MESTTVGQFLFWLALAFGFGLLIGFSWGNGKKGFIVNYTNGLPRTLFRVVKTDKVSTELETISVEPTRILVSTKVFGGKPIRPKDTVRVIKTRKEHKESGIPVLGYPPLVKIENEEGGQS